MRIPVVLHKDADSDYGVIVPDLPGCFTAGSTVNEALDMAKEAVEGHIEVLLEDGDSLPAPRPIEEHMANPEYAGGIWMYVDVDALALLGKTSRYNLTLPETLVSLVDQFLRSHRTAYRSRSDFFAKLAAEFLQLHR